MRKPTPRSFAAFLALSVLISAPARADDPQPPQQAPASDDRQPSREAPPAGSPDEVVCKVRSEPAIGSKINRRIKICRPRRDWDEETRIGQGTMTQIQKSNGGQSNILPMGPAGRGNGGRGGN